MTASPVVTVAVSPVVTVTASPVVTVTASPVAVRAVRGSGDGLTAD